MDTRQLVGTGFLLGDAALFANGLLAWMHAPGVSARQAGLGRMSAGLLWGFNGALLAHYGGQPVEKQAERLQGKLAEYLRHEQVPLEPMMQRQADRQRHRGFGQRVEEMLYNHPVEFTNFYSALSAAGFAVSGLLRRKEGRSLAGNANLGMSALIMTGLLAGIFLPERSREQVEARGQQDTLWGNIQERPLSYVKWLFIASTLMNGVGAKGEYEAAKALPKGDAFRNTQFAMAGLSLAAMGTFLACDWTMGDTVKHAGGTPEAQAAGQEEILRTAARVIAGQPEAVQTRLIHHTAEYLSHQPELWFSGRLPGKIEAQLRAQIAHYAAGQEKPVVGMHTERLQPSPGSDPLAR